MIRISKSRKSTVREEDGFTVVEVLVAAAVVVVGFLGLATMFPTGYSTVTKSGIQGTGLALAQQRIEVLRNAGYSNITNGTTTESLTTPYSGYTRTTVVQDPAVVNNDDTCPGSLTGSTVNSAKKVCVRVTMPSAGTPASQDIVLTTIVAK